MSLTKISGDSHAHSMKNEIATNPAYRKVVAALDDCEKRYDSLIKGTGASNDLRLASTVAILKDEVEKRRRLEVEFANGSGNRTSTDRARFARRSMPAPRRDCTPKWFSGERSKRVRREIGRKSGKNTVASNRDHRKLPQSCERAAPNHARISRFACRPGRTRCQSTSRCEISLASFGKDRL